MLMNKEQLYQPFDNWSNRNNLKPKNSIGVQIDLIEAFRVKDQWVI